MDDPSENLNIISIKEIISIENDIEAINKNQSDIKITISEMNSLEWINSRLEEAKNQTRRQDNSIQPKRKWKRKET